MKILRYSAKKDVEIRHYLAAFRITLFFDQMPCFFKSLAISLQN